MKSDVFSLFNHCAKCKHFIQHTKIQISNLVHTTRFCNNLHYQIIQMSYNNQKRIAIITKILVISV